VQCITLPRSALHYRAAQRSAAHDTAHGTAVSADYSGRYCAQRERYEVGSLHAGRRQGVTHSEGMRKNMMVEEEPDRITKEAKPAWPHTGDK
jgi:hypothetical protein